MKFVDQNGKPVKIETADKCPRPGAGVFQTLKTEAGEFVLMGTTDAKNESKPIVGGSVDKKESWEDAIVREYNEETFQGLTQLNLEQLPLLAKELSEIQIAGLLPALKPADLENAVISVNDKRLDPTEKSPYVYNTAILSREMSKENLDVAIKLMNRLAQACLVQRRALLDDAALPNELMGRDGMLDKKSPFYVSTLLGHIKDLKKDAATAEQAAALEPKAKLLETISMFTEMKQFGYVSKADFINAAATFAVEGTAPIKIKNAAGAGEFEVTKFALKDTIRVFGASSAAEYNAAVAIKKAEKAAAEAAKQAVPAAAVAAMVLSGGAAKAEASAAAPAQAAKRPSVSHV